jgi:hypothetical protein
MNNKRVLFFLTVGVMALAVFALVGSPYVTLNFADAQYYGSGGDGDDDDDGADSGTSAALQGQLAAGTAVSIRLGSAAPAPRVGALIPRNISGCPLKDAPEGNILPFTFSGEAKDVGQNEDGTSLLVIIGGGQGAWVDIEDCPQAFF